MREEKPSISVPASQNAANRQEGFRLHVETDLVVLHATVLDKQGKPVTELTQRSLQGL